MTPPCGVPFSERLHFSGLPPSLFPFRRLGFPAKHPDQLCVKSWKPRSGRSGPPLASARKPEASRAVSNQSTLSGPRHRPLADPVASVLESPPALDAPSAQAGTHRSNPRNPLRRSAPVSTGSPSGLPGLAPLEYPRVVTCRAGLLGGRRASLAAVCRIWRATIPEPRPEIPSRLLSDCSICSIDWPS